MGLSNKIHFLYFLLLFIEIYVSIPGIQCMIRSSRSTCNIESIPRSSDLPNTLTGIRLGLWLYRSRSRRIRIDQDSLKSQGLNSNSRSLKKKKSLFFYKLLISSFTNLNNNRD